MMNAVGLGIKNLSHEGDNTTPIYVCGYVRCSTQHEAQLEAVDAQEQWLRDYISLRPNWILTEVYVDKGITGTVTEKRPEFQRMLEDAKKRKFSLICSRELCRFSRNTLHTIQITRELAELYQTECFFISDNIWTMSNTGELKLNLMATLAQEESRKCAERVYHGLQSVRNRQTLLGNGNCFAYRLIRGEHAIDNKYEIVPQEAETVKDVFFYYLDKGMGIKAISRELIKQNRTNASGNVEWDSTRVRRILRNRTYAGYIGYNKSNTINYLKHNRRNNPDWRTHEYVYAGDKIPAIITDEQWQQAQELLDSRTAEYHGKRRGVNPVRNVWLTKLQCSCGSHFKRYHWRTNSNVRTDSVPTQVYGYACANNVNNGGKEFRREYGVDGGCSTKSFPEWKAVLALKTLCSRLLKNPTKTKEKMIALITKYYEPMNQPVFATKDVYEKDLAKVERRLKSLFEMRMDGSISADEFKETKKELDAEKERLLGKIAEIDRSNDAVAKAEDMEGQISEISTMLDSLLDLDGNEVSEELIRVLIQKIVVCPGYLFKFYLNLRGNQDGEPVLCDSFHITYEQASEYRQQCGTYVRKCQWPTDLLVEVYI